MIRLDQATGSAGCVSTEVILFAEPWGICLSLITGLRYCTFSACEGSKSYEPYVIVSRH